MRYPSVVLISFLLAGSAPAVELFRYTLSMPDGREFEYVFETEEQSVPETIDQDRAEQIAIDWIMRFHGGPKIGSIESVTFRQKPIPH